MDRYLAGIVLLVLIICSLFLLDDLRVIELPFFNRATHENHELVGHVALVHNQVKRRSQDDFLWSGTKRNENIYFYDSILTLSESQVRLELFGKSKIDLSENTLIVIEPSLNGNRDEIRLKFKRGSLKSKDLSQSTQIQAGQWELKLESGTDFHLRSQDNDTFELEVQKGSAKVVSDGKERTITSDEALILKPTSLEKIDLNTKLDWNGPAFKRVYTHDESSKVALNWKGKAQTLAHSQKNNSEDSVTLDQSESYAIDLPIGTHFFRLKDSNSSSKLLTVELNRAPSVHLYYPLPRDRVEYTRPVTFTWRKVSDLTKYRLELAKDAEFKTPFKSFETAKNFYEYKPEELGRFYWRIVGIDHEGFEVPPAYSNEILFIENPLGAPGIETPERKPSEQDSRWDMPKGLWFYSLLSLFVSVAQADDHMVTFEWTKVKNADTYNLEVDDDPFFQSPEVITTTRNTYYQWSTKSKGLVYWRVAGDSKKGRLGLFSPVQKSDLSKLKFSRMPSGDFDVYIKDTSEVPAEPLPPPVESNYPPPLKEEPEKVAEPLSQTTGYFAYGVGYGYYLFKTQNIEKVTLMGLQPLNLSGDYNFHQENYSIKVKADMSYSSWKADQKKFPFQTEQEVFTGSVSALHSSRAREIWFGVRASQLFEPKRLGLESMELQPLYVFGPTVQFDALISATVLNHLSSSLLVGSSTYLLDIDNTVRRRQMVTHDSAISLGLRTNIGILSLKDANGMSYSGQIQLVIGFDW